MPASEWVLYQFPVSHYCEKSRWMLEAKEIRYRIKNLLPGPHRAFLRARGGRGTVPAMKAGDVFLEDSRAIALHVAAQPSGVALLPAGGAARSRILQLCDEFDDRIGPAARVVAYGHLLDDAPAFRRVFFGGFGPVGRLAGYALQTGVRRAIRRMYSIDSRSTEAARQLVIEGVERIERDLKGGDERYLVGGALSMADITVAALLSPLVMPPESPYGDVSGLPHKLLAFRDELRARAGGQWVLRMYSEHRRARPDTTLDRQGTSSLIT